MNDQTGWIFHQMCCGGVILLSSWRCAKTGNFLSSANVAGWKIFKITHFSRFLIGSHAQKPPRSIKHEVPLSNSPSEISEALRDDELEDLESEYDEDEMPSLT